MAITTGPDSAPSQRSGSERFLGLFTDVRPGEGSTALLSYTFMALLPVLAIVKLGWLGFTLMIIREHRKASQGIAWPATA